MNVSSTRPRAIFVNPFLPEHGSNYARAWLEREIVSPSYSALSGEDSDDFNSASLFFKVELSKIYKPTAIQAAKRLLVLLE